VVGCFEVQAGTDSVARLLVRRGRCFPLVLFAVPLLGTLMA